MGATSDIAEWASSVRYEDVPARVHELSKAQILSVLGAIHAGRHSEAAMSGLEAARAWSGRDEATVFVTGERLSLLDAVFANTCASVSFDFDDYLFAGHTGHSAVCAALAYAERHELTGRDVLASIAVANEVGGRLGASLLFGPQNGQMWSYIHLIEGACIAARAHGLDAARTSDAIGIAFTQPPYPLMPGFMGPDGKLLIPATTSVEGCRAGELAARGWTGSHVILEDRQGFLRRFNENNLGFMLSGFGEAWVSDSLSYKVVPGCAYIDTAVDAFQEISRSFAGDHGRAPASDDVEAIDVRCGIFTSGMEAFSQMYRSADRLEPITVNFSVALSFGLQLVAGGLRPEFLSHGYLDANRASIESAAAKVTLAHDPAIDKRAAAASESGGFSLRSVLSGASDAGGLVAGAGEAVAALAEGAGPPPKSLRGVSFEGYVMAFPAEVTLRTTAGQTYPAVQDVPLGAAGRPWAETRERVHDKFRENFPGDAQRAIEAVESLEDASDVRTVVRALSA